MVMGGRGNRGSRYHKAHGLKTQKAVDDKNLKVWFEDRKGGVQVLQFDHIPYIILGKRVLLCQSGQTKHRAIATKSA